VSCHRTGVTKTEVNIFAVVDVGDVREFGGFDEDRESASPFFHPVHRDAAEE